MRATQLAVLLEEKPSLIGVAVEPDSMHELEGEVRKFTLEVLGVVSGWLMVLLVVA